MYFFLLLMAVCGYFTFLYQRESILSEPWIPDAESILFTERPFTPLVLHDHSILQPPLRAEGRHVIDSKDTRFKLSSVNWYGASDELFIPGGLDIQHRSTIAKTIKLLGFNSVRLPYSDEMVVTNPEVMPHLLAANADLVGLRALDIFEAVVNALTDEGIAVIPNNHITHATWCCGADPCDASWSNDHLGTICKIRQTEEDWIVNWETIMAPHISNPLVIGADLRNEVRGLWGTMSWDRWVKAAELAGDRLLRMNPNWLIIVGGTGSGNFLTGARDRPVKLIIPNRVVYSAHVYSWSGWGSRDGRYAQRDYASFVKSMRENWAYLIDEEIAPVWIGEFGESRHPGQGGIHYWNNLLKYLKSIDADFAYWAINPRKPKDNEKETYSLVEDDWVTPIMDYRMKDLRELIKGPRN
jgi:endoglucanase